MQAMNRAKIELGSGERLRGRLPAACVSADFRLSICEECGKKYRVDVNKLKGRAAAFTCRSCGHQIIVTRPQGHISEIQAADGSIPSLAETLALEENLPEALEPASAAAAANDLDGRRRRALGRIGLRLRLVLIFLVLPVGIMAAAGLIFQRFLEYRIYRLSQENRQLADLSAEERIAGLSEAVAAQVKLYLQWHPGVAPQDFDRDAVLRDIVLQPVGKSGFIFFYERPIASESWRIWMNGQRQLAGTDLGDLRRELGAHFPRFWEVVTGVGGGRLSRGYCFWRDRNGKFREAFLACTPIVDSPYVIAAAAYMEEFNGPSAQMETRLAEFKADMRLMALGGLGGAFLLSILAMWTLGLRLAERFRGSPESGSGQSGGAGA